MWYRPSGRDCTILVPFLDPLLQISHILGCSGRVIKVYHYSPGAMNLSMAPDICLKMPPVDPAVSWYLIILEREPKLGVIIHIIPLSAGELQKWLCLNHVSLVSSWALKDL